MITVASCRYMERRQAGQAFILEDDNTIKNSSKIYWIIWWGIIANKVLEMIFANFKLLSSPEMQQ